MSLKRAAIGGLCILFLVGVATMAAQPVITGVSIPDGPMNIGDTVTAMISVQSDSLTTYDLNSSTIGGYALSNRIRLDSTTYTAQFTIISGGTDYAAGDSIPTSVTLADGGLTDTWSVAITQANDPIDANAPTIAISDDEAGTANIAGGDVTYTFDFNETVTGFTSSDVAVANGTKGIFTPVSGTQYTLVVTPDADFEGDLTVDVAVGVAIDGLGNPNTAATQSVQSVDTLAPYVTSLNRDSSSPTNANTVTYTVSFNEPVSDIEIGDFAVVLSGTTGTVNGVSNSTGTAATVSVGSVAGDGTLGLNFDYDALDSVFDSGGNPATTDFTGQVYTIDNTPPAVIVDIADGALNDGDNSSLVTFEFSEDVQGFTLGSVSESGGILSSFTQIDADSYTAVFTATDGVDVTGSVTVLAGTYTDPASNNGTSGSDTVDIDTDNPAVASVTADDTWITDADMAGGGSLSIVVTFDEAMDTTTIPTLVFDQNCDATLALNDADWSNATTFEVLYDAVDANEYIEDVYVDVTGALDAVGNPQEDYTPAKEFDIDTENPSATVVFTDPLLTDADADSVVTITFSEAVSNFTIDDLTPTNGNLSSFTPVNLAEWTVLFTADDNVDGTGTVAVGTAYEDYRGNPPNSGASGDTDIDTRNPEVSTVVASTAMIYEGDLQQTVTVTFNEPMDTATDPTISFGVGTFTTNSDGNWDSSTQYSESFTHTDTNIEQTYVEIGVSGAKDAVGNDQQPYTPEDEFDIDTIKPTATGFWLSEGDSLISDPDVGSTLRVTTDFSEPMDTGTAPTLTFSPALGTTLSFDSGSWLDSDTYAADYDMLDGNVDHDDVTIDVSGAKDAAGNDQEDFTPTREFEVDTYNPSVTNVATNDALITDADTPGTASFVVTIEFDEAMNTALAPTVSFSETLTTTLTLSGTSAWLDNDTYEAIYDVDDGNVDHDTIQIDVTGAEDAAENEQLDYTPENEFGLDTVNPTVTAVAVDDTLLADSDDGTTFTVTVDFSEPMTDDGSADPTLTFNPAVGTTLAFTSDSWPTTTRYQAVYGISDAGVDEDSVTIDVTLADDENGNPQQDYAPLHEFEIDTLNPTVTSVVLSDNLITDADVGDTFTVTIDYSEPMLTTAPSLIFSPDLSTTLSFQAGSSGWTDTDTYVASYTILDGNTTVLDDDITITSAQDLAGNVQVAYNYDDQLDVDTENPYVHDFTVTGGAVDGSCLRVVTFTAKVTDPNGTMVPGDITVTSATVVNATIGAVYDINQTSDSATTITITGKVDVTALTGCPAPVTITLDAVDSVDNDAAQQAQSDDVVDTTIPVINDLKFNTDDSFTSEQTIPYLVDECGLVIVYFSANVTDNCCIVPGNVIVSASLPMSAGEGDAILEDVIVTRVQNGQGRVDVTGSAVVRCLESCPPGVCMSRVQIDITAADCCGNVAIPDATGTGEGLVDDDILPIPRDDPRQDMVMDESAVIDPLVEVRLDEFGTYRLVLRESTPVRIDILANDADNLSHNSAHPFAPCILCGPCGGQTGCCATMYIHEIVKEPSYGTATIEDDTGDCTGGTAIRYAPDRGYLGQDYFTYRTRDAFGNVSTEIATVYLQVVPEVWMEDVFVIACSGETVEFRVLAADLFIDPDDPSIIEFSFSMPDGPEHGVIGGSLLDIVYTPPSTITDPQFGVQVPSLDFSEAAAVMLTYTPADGFVGRDRARIRFEDPFGGAAIAVVDIAVGLCVGTDPASVVTVFQGQLVPLIVPLTFAPIFEAGMGTVTLLGLEDGVLHASAIYAEWSEAVGRHILTIDTAGLPLGSYELKIPLGTGEAVTLTIEVGEAE